MKMAHQLPQFDHEEVIAVIRSTGQHHKELLHEICDVLHDQAIDVIHAEVPPHRASTPCLHTVPPSAPCLHTVRPHPAPCLHLHRAHAMPLQMDTNSMGKEEHALYVTRCDDKPTDRAQRTMLRAAINELYLKHDEVSTENGGFSVSVLPLRAEGSSAVVELPEKISTVSTHTLASRTKSAKVAFGAGDGGVSNGSVELRVEMQEVAAQPPVVSGAANV